MAHGTCIVTGGAGFIGCALSSALVSHFDRVIAIDNLHSQVHEHHCRPAALDRGVTWVDGDICDAVVWDQVLATTKPTAVIHLAAETGTGQSLTAATRHAECNTVGTAVMLDALARHRVVPERIVTSSSRAVYGEGGWTGKSGTIYPGPRSRAQLANATWDFPGLSCLPSSAQVTRPVPVSIYGATKLSQEHMIAVWAAAFGSEAVTLRLQNVYGPGQAMRNTYTGIVVLFCQLARAGRSIPLYEDGAMLRDFVYIDDVASAFMAALTRPAAPHPLDIGTGQSTTVADMAGQIAGHYGAPPPHVTGTYRFGDVRHAAVNISAARNLLRWAPKIMLAEGLPRLAEWVDAQVAAPGQVGVPAERQAA